jgi:hypothetical protein
MTNFVAPARQERDRNDRYFRFAYEFLVSLNVALIIRWQSAQTSFSSLESNLQFWINGQLRLHPHSSIGKNSAFFLMALPLTLGIFVLLRLASVSPIVRKALYRINGAVSLLALPAGWLYVTHNLPVLPGMLDPPRAALFVELAAVVVCYIFYLKTKWQRPDWISFLLLILHFGFWGWLFLGGAYFWLAPFQLIFPIVGLCSCLAWAIYAGATTSLS